MNNEAIARIDNHGFEGCDECGDPFPYVGEHGSRHAYPGTLNGKPLVFAPRQYGLNVQGRLEVRAASGEDEDLSNASDLEELAHLIADAVTPDDAPRPVNPATFDYTAAEAILRAGYSRAASIAVASYREGFMRGWYSARTHGDIAAATHSPDFRPSWHPTAGSDDEPFTSDGVDATGNNPKPTSVNSSVGSCHCLGYGYGCQKHGGAA